MDTKFNLGDQAYVKITILACIKTEDDERYKCRVDNSLFNFDLILDENVLLTPDEVSNHVEDKNDYVKYPLSGGW